MATRLADRLSAARHRRFVGRNTERALFRSILTAGELPFQVLYVYGPGGVGKSTLLGEFSYLCTQASIDSCIVDGRNVEPVPGAFEGALRTSLGLKADQMPLQALAEQPGRHVVLVDTYETLGDLDGWLRDTFLPEAPENVLFVLAGREPPSLSWRADPGWQTLLRTIPLRNLTPDEARSYLAHWDIPESEYQALLDFTHGHPLALSLVADVFAQRGELHFNPHSAPDVVQSLLQQFVQKVPGPAHRTALEACALVRLTTENLLAELLSIPDAHELFDWLRDLSFMEASQQGLYLHDLAREALVADLRWRNPDWYAELHRRARTSYSKRFQQSKGDEQQRVLIEYIYLHRDNQVVRPFFDMLRQGPTGQESGGLSVGPLQPAETPLLQAMVARHEGAEAAQLAAHWLQRQPGGASIFRDGVRAVGFLMMVALDEATSEDFELDPAAGAAFDYLQRHGPLRPGERATLFRFWMAEETYQDVSPTQSLIFVNMVRHYLTAPGLAFTFLPCAEPDFWSGMFAYADLARLPEADYELAGHRFGVYGHDWRAMPPLAWLELLAEREIAMSAQAGQAPPPAVEALVVLSQPDFMNAVRDALRDFTRADVLRGNPLLRSRLVVERAGAGAAPAERVAALQGLVRETAQALEASPRDAKLYRAVDHTYLHPAATQEQAAEVLDLPFSTYRRHLTTGVSRLAEILWQRELEAPG